MFETSNVFSSLKDFNKEYKSIRELIMIRHGFDKNSKVRLKNAVMLYINFGDGFIKYTSTHSTMKERIKMYEVSDKEVSFKIVAMV